MQDIRCFYPSFAIRNSTTLSRLTTKADKTKKTNKTKKVEHNKEKGGRGLVILGPMGLWVRGSDMAGRQ